MTSYPTHIGLQIESAEAMRALWRWARDYGSRETVRELEDLLEGDPSFQASLDKSVADVYTGRLAHILMRRNIHTVGQLIALTPDEVCVRGMGTNAISRTGPGYRELVEQLYLKTGLTLKGAQPPGL